MNLNRSLAVVAGFTAALQLATAGYITGKVTLKGTPPPEKEITQVKDDVNCGKLHTEAVKTRFFVVGAGGELADTVVMLKGITGKSPLVALHRKAAPTGMEQAVEVTAGGAKADFTLEVK